MFHWQSVVDICCLSVLSLNVRGVHATPGCCGCSRAACTHSIILLACMFQWQSVVDICCLGVLSLNVRGVHATPGCCGCLRAACARLCHAAHSHVSIASHECNTLCLTSLADEGLRQDIAGSLDACSFGDCKCGTAHAVYQCLAHWSITCICMSAQAKGARLPPKRELSGVAKALCERDEEVGERLRRPAHKGMPSAGSGSHQGGQLELGQSLTMLQCGLACCWRAYKATWPPTGHTGPGKGSADLFGAPVADEPHDCERVGVSVRKGHPDVDGDDSYDGDGCNPANHCKGRARRATLPAPHTCAACTRHRASKTRLEQASMCKSPLHPHAAVTPGDKHGRSLQECTYT